MSPCVISYPCGEVGKYILRTDGEYIPRYEYGNLVEKEKGVKVIVVGNGHGDKSSNPGPG